MIEDINNLDLMFNKVQGETKTLVREARENYISTLNNFEVCIAQLTVKFLLFVKMFMHFRNFY